MKSKAGATSDGTLGSTSHQEAHSGHCHDVEAELGRCSIGGSQMCSPSMMGGAYVETGSSSTRSPAADARLRTTSMSRMDAATVSKFLHIAAMFLAVSIFVGQGMLSGPSPDRET
jgi:hypothetical protein